MWWLVACERSEGVPKDDPAGVHHTGLAHSAAESPAPTGHSARAHSAAPCEPDVAVAALYHFDLFEDFDVMPDDTLVTGANGHLLFWQPGGPDSTLPLPGFDNPTGIRRLPDGRLAFSDPANAVVAAADPVTGASTVLATGLVVPNGLTVGLDGALYASDYRVGGGVWRIPLDGGAPELLVTLDRPNGLAATADGAILIAADTVILRLDPRSGALDTVAETAGLWTTVAADVCGGVWTVGYNDHVVVRIPPGGPPEELLVLDDPGISSHGSNRFGTGSAAWPADHWLVGGYHTGLWDLSLGIEGVR